MRVRKVITEGAKSILPNNLLMHRLPRGARNSILLTFDDGPDENGTPRILRLLEKYQARAVFFVVGRRVEQFPHLLSLMVQKGHLIGNHSYLHPKGKMPRMREVRSYRQDLVRCQELIEKTIGRRPTLFRPPRGFTLASLLAARSMKLQTVMYSAEGGEWGFRKSSDARTIAKDLVRTIRPRDIVLFHDDNSKVPDILEMIMPDIKERHFDVSDGILHLTGRSGG